MAARDGVYAVNLIARGNWSNVGVIGHQIGRERREKFETNFLKREKKRIFQRIGYNTLHRLPWPRSLVFPIDQARKAIVQFSGKHKMAATSLPVPPVSFMHCNTHKIYL